MTKRKPDPAETPEDEALPIAPPTRPRVTYQTGTGGSVTIDPPEAVDEIMPTKLIDVI